MLNCQVKDSAPNSPVDGGLIMNNITHQGHRFADEVRVIGFWLEWKERTYPVGQPNAKPVKIEIKSEFFTLSREFFDMSDIEEMFPSAEKAKIWGQEWDAFRKSGSALGFGHFPFYFGLRVVCRSKPGIFAHIPNLDKGGLEVKQTTLFSKYANMPPHEPSGGLTAARFHPMTTTKFADNAVYDAQAVVRSEVISIRYDYYLHLNLDRNHDVVKNFGMEQLGNQAGVFKDRDEYFYASLGELIGTGIGTIRDGFSAAPVVFKGAEKPLVLEICSMGLSSGMPFDLEKQKGERLYFWDNIHWWGTRSASYPSTPGAFHAVHLHWRWGGAISVAPYGFEPQFSKSGVPQNWLKNPRNFGGNGPVPLTGALLDPKCWIQSLFFAVVIHESSNRILRDYLFGEVTDEAKQGILQLLSLVSPKQVTNLSGTTGENLALVLSLRVSKNHLYPEFYEKTRDLGIVESIHRFPQVLVESGISGTIFVHGIFFAHESEVNSYFPPSGDLGKLYIGNSSEEIRETSSWERY